MSNGIDERTAGLSPERRALLELRIGKQRAAEIMIPRRKDRGRGPAPLSFAQQRLWLLDHIAPGNVAYNVPRALRLTGPLVESALERALDAIVQRHEVLRTPFAWEDGRVVQVVLAEAPRLTLARADLTHLPHGRREAELTRRMAEELRRPFDLSHDMMLRATLYRLGLEDHALLVCTHHIASDGWSKGVLFRELSVLYDAFSQAAPGMVATLVPSPLPELPIQYADYALWQRDRLQGKALDDLLAYWRGHLAGAPPALELPADRPRPAAQTYRGEKQYPAFPRALYDDLKALAKREGVTLFMLLMAAWKALLFRSTGQADVVVGTTIAGRTRAETEGLVGFFMNTLVLRTDLSDDPPFRELLKRERAVLLGAYEHQEIPFEKLVEEISPVRDLSRSPLVQVMLLLDAPGSPPSLRDLTVTPIEVDTGAAKYDMILGLTEDAGELRGKVEYNTDLFDAATVARLLRHFEVLLASAVERPEARVTELAILPPEEREALLVGWNQTRADYPRDLCAHELVTASAARSPEATAVVFEREAQTFAELERRSNQIAWHLARRGVPRGARVSVALPRSGALVPALLGVLKAGCAYVPIDPAYPADRIAFMLEDAAVSAILTDAETATALPTGALAAAAVVRIDADAQAIAAESAAEFPRAATPESVAYVIYTSGSTGRPKGVQVLHRALVNFLTSMRARPGITERDVLVAVTSLSFDIAGLELFLPLIAGARVVVSSREVASDGARLRALLEGKAGVEARPCSHFQATPSTFRILLEAGWEGSPTLTLLCGGEALPRDLAHKLLERSGALFNVYGPTETTIWSTLYPIAGKASPVLIGRPIANTELYILDARREPAPIGVPGELFIGGDGLAIGYLNRPELTAERFVKHPFSPDPAARLYRTGDLCRYREGGDVEFLGRLDHQVKIRGFRIELGEIEAVLAEHPGVAQAVAVVRDEPKAGPRLVAYLVPALGVVPSAADLRAHLRARLPEIMVPTTLVTLAALPLTANGKIDRRALPPPDAASPDAASPEEAEGRAPSGPLEEALAAMWRDLLGAPRVRANSNFFELGGHSLLAMQLVRMIEGSLSVEIPMRAVFEATTLEALAARVAEAKGSGAREDAAMREALAALEGMSEDEAARLLASDL
jgi:amino acid adenylation domain-containing protein